MGRGAQCLGTAFANGSGSIVGCTSGDGVCRASSVFFGSSRILSSPHGVRRCRGDGGGKAQQGSVIVRTRDDGWGACSGVRAGGSTIALMVKLRSVYPTLPEKHPVAVLSIR